MRSIPSGTFTRRAASTAISSAKPPQIEKPITLSPGATPVTPSPTSRTTPATSPPGEKGRGGLN